MKKSKLISVLKYIFFLGIGLALLWHVTSGHDYEEFVNEFKYANYYWIGFAMCCGAVSHVIRALRWNLLINSMGYKTKFSTTFYAVMLGYFANLIVPRLGEISRCALLKKHENIPFNALLGTVVAERIFDFLCLVLIAILVVYFQFDFLKGFINAYFYGPLFSQLTSNVWLLLFAFVLFIVLAVIAFFVLKAFYSRHKEKSIVYKVRNLALGFADGIKTIKRVPHKILFLTHTLLIWVLYFFMTYLCFFSLQATSHLTIADGFTILVMGSLGIVAPVPGGIGAYHFIVIMTLVELFGIAATPATSLAYISHTSQTLLILLLSLVSFIGLMFVAKKNKKNAHPRAHK